MSTQDFSSRTIVFSLTLFLSLWTLPVVLKDSSCFAFPYLGLILSHNLRLDLSPCCKENTSRLCSLKKEGRGHKEMFPCAQNISTQSGRWIWEKTDLRNAWIKGHKRMNYYIAMVESTPYILHPLLKSMWLLGSLSSCHSCVQFCQSKIRKKLRWGRREDTSILCVQGRQEQQHGWGWRTA